LLNKLKHSQKCIGRGPPFAGPRATSDPQGRLCPPSKPSANNTITISSRPSNIYLLFGGISCPRVCSHCCSSAVVPNRLVAEWLRGLEQRPQLGLPDHLKYFQGHLPFCEHWNFTSCLLWIHFRYSCV